MVSGSKLGVDLEVQPDYDPWALPHPEAFTQKGESPWREAPDMCLERSE